MKHVQHEVISLVENSQKDLELLLKVIEKNEKTEGSTIIFCESKKQAIRVNKYLLENEVDNLLYYADLKSEERVGILSQFNSKREKYVVSTNLLAHGFDTIHVDHVIQFEYAKNTMDYIHRIGRTGRLGKPGKVTSFIRKDDTDLYEKIKEIEKADGTLEEAFSRNRSFRHNLKKKLKEKKNVEKLQNNNDAISQELEEDSELN